MKLHLGFASGAEKNFRGVDYAANFVNLYDDKNYFKYTESHPQIDGVFFQDRHT